MRHGLCRRHSAHLVKRVGPERPAACGQRDFADLTDFAARKTLEDGVMLRVHRQQRRARSGNGGHHQCACGNQRFLIGKRNGFACLDGGHGGGKPRTADDGGHRPVCTHTGGVDEGNGASSGFDVGSSECRLQSRIGGFIGHNGHLSVEFYCQLSKISGIAIGGKRDNAIGIAVLTHEV